MRDRRQRRRVSEPGHVMLHIYAALAEKERRLIGERTKAALQAARDRGVVLGGHREQSDITPRRLTIVPASSPRSLRKWPRSACGQRLRS
jgi:DNA invertase Pin-like site-specific DNA recombinase